jgi:hypothetical protein
MKNKTKSIGELKKELKTSRILEDKLNNYSSILDDVQWEVGSSAGFVGAAKDTKDLLKSLISAGGGTEEITLLVESIQLIISQCKSVSKHINKEVKQVEKQMNAVAWDVVNAAK